MTQKYQSILKDADQIVNQDRREAYGAPLESFERIAQLWSVILGTPITPDQVGLCMIALKISRECHAHNRDNLIDIAGYSEAMNLARHEADIKDLIASK